MVDYSQAMASIARACPKLRQMDHVAVDEQRGWWRLSRRKVLRAVQMKYHYNDQSKCECVDSNWASGADSEDRSVVDIFCGAFN